MSAEDALSETHLLPLLIAAYAQLSEGVIIADAKGKLVFVNRRAETLHGVKRLDVEPEDYSDVYSLKTMEGDPYPPGDLPMARAVLKGEIVEDALWKITRPDGTEIIALGTAKPVFNTDKEQIASVLTISDYTAEFMRTRELEAALDQSEMMLVETNHRVKNNLQIVSSLLGMEALRSESDGTRKVLEDLSQRIDVIADVNRRLYVTEKHIEVDIVNQLADFASTSLTRFVELSGVDLKVEANGQAMISVDKAVSLSLAVNELVLNSIRHAFDGIPEPQIKLSINAADNVLNIDYLDNGNGLSASRDGSKDGGFGQLLITGLERQMQAQLTPRTDGPGYGLTITVSLT